jgi:hypothetical protein
MTLQTPTRRRSTQAPEKPRPAILRVRHREGQRVRASDLLDEQAFHIAARRRHYLGAHDWGIVRGLKLVPASDGIVIQPGFAVDGYGRELIVARAVSLPAADLQDCFGSAASDSGEMLDVWLAYRQGDPHGARRSVHSDVILTPHSASSPDSASPPGVPSADLSFGAHQALYGDAPVRAFPVYLGSIRKQGDTLEIVSNEKPRTTRLFAGSVTSPDGRTRLVLGDERADDPRRFAVVMAAGDLVVERMVINKRGGLTLRGKLELERVRQSQPEAAAGVDDCRRPALPDARSLSVRFSPAPTPTSPQPWRIYTTRVTEGEGDDKRHYHELRIELFHPGKYGNAHDYRLQVGVSDGGVFKPAFAVYADGVVRAYGIVAAKRRLQSPIGTDPNDPSLREMLDTIRREKFTDDELEIRELKATNVGRARDTAALSFILANKTPPPGEVISSIRFYQFIRHQDGSIARAEYGVSPVASLTRGQSRTIALQPLEGLKAGTYTVAVFAYGTRERGGITLVTKTTTFDVQP